MDRLTREEIEVIRSDFALTENKEISSWFRPKPTTLKNLCDLALQSLSNEAVRDEALVALEEGYAVLADITNQWEGRHTIEGQKLLCKMRDAIASATGRSAEDVQDNPIALKREPNAAAWDRSTERASGERTSAGTSPSPAPAAPDVASMVKLGQEWVPVSDEESLGAYLTGIPGKPIYAVDERTQPFSRWRFELPSLPPAPGASDD